MVCFNLWEPGRAAALARLEDFLPRVGDYARLRNFDFGPGRRDNVSGLSPYVTARVISEEEIIRATLNQYSPGQVEKFLQEVIWRTYWKGWLEMRPEVWDSWVQDCERLGRGDQLDGVLRAEAGETGIECFDAWAKELVNGGWLHNHARMWFASIWIFTLRLPWQLGARFFFRHLLDADAASNTLSWRWVAGLHTRGKHYVARAENIRKYTDGRFDPTGQLREECEPLPLDQEFENRSVGFDAGKAFGRVGLLLHGEDASFDLVYGGNVAAAATVGSAVGTQNADWCELVREFRDGTIREAGLRVADSAGCRLTELTSKADLERWIAEEKLDCIATSYLPVGPWRDGLGLWIEGSDVIRVVVRDWDRDLWPGATSGFFRFKSELPKIVRRLQSV